MAANAEIFFEHGPWGRALAWSVGLHVAFAAFVVLYAVIIPATSGQGWGAGGGGEAMGVTLVSTVPLPANPAPTENVLANESKGLTQSKPQAPTEEAKLPDAIPIPDKDTKQKPKPTISASRRKPTPQPVEEANNVVPF